MKKIFLKIAYFVFSTIYSHSSIGQPVARDTNILARVMNFNWTPDGKSVLFTVLKWNKQVKGSSRSSVYSLNINSGAIDHLIGDGSNNPSMSPDGTMIAFTKDAVAGSSDIYIYDTKTRNISPLATDSTREMAPNWSPDGSFITYCAEKNKAIDVYVINVKTGESRQITISGIHKSYSPAWSPDGKHIVYYFETGDNRDQIFLTDPEGSFHKNLTADTATHNFYPSWVSKKDILYTRNSTGIAIIDCNGTFAPRDIPGIRTYFARHHPQKKQIAYIGIPPEKNLILYDLKRKTSKVLIDEEMLYKIL